MKMIVERRSDLFVVVSFFVIFNTPICLNAGAEARLSGVYGDNGLDQTIIHHTLTSNDQREVEQEILELLGLPERPSNIHPSIRRSAPKFLLDIYKRSLAEEELDNAGRRHTRSAEESDQLITAIDKEVIDQSDIIMTFLNKNHHVPDVRHERGSRVWFDTSEVSRDLTLMMAELRLFQQHVDVLNVSRHGGWSGHSHHLNAKDGSVFTVSVYNVVSVEEDSGEHKELELIAAVNTTNDYVGWLEMNITSALSQWVGDITNNHGLYIGVRSVLRPEHEIRLEELGLVTRGGDEESQPFMIGFFKGLGIVHPTKSQRAQHGHNKNHHHHHQQQKGKEEEEENNGGGRSKRNAPKRKKPESQRQPFYEPVQRTSGGGGMTAGTDAQSCQIQQLYVSFKDLKWHDWIIAPDGYGAYYCSGECNFPMNSHMNATNHAIVQTLVHLLHPTKVPKPCCAPTKLSPISVLYFIDESNVMLKKYKNMVVKSCGCH